MPRKHVLPPHDMLSSADMSTNLTSEPTNVSQIDQAIIFLNWTGVVTGAFTVQGAQVRSDQLRANNPLPSDITWNDLTFGNPILADGANSHQIIFTELPFTHIRLKFTTATGAGTLDATVSGKSGGA